jgi:hypothetical protein
LPERLELTLGVDALGRHSRSFSAGLYPEGILLVRIALLKSEPSLSYPRRAGTVKTKQHNAIQDFHTAVAWLHLV